MTDEAGISRTAAASGPPTTRPTTETEPAAGAALAAGKGPAAGVGIAAGGAAETSQEYVLGRWVAQLLAALELDATEIDIDDALALAGEAAHAVVRPAAPLTTLIVGLAAGLAAGSGQAHEQLALSSAIDVARRLCRERAAQAAEAGKATETARHTGTEDAGTAPGERSAPGAPGQNSGARS